VGDSNLFLSVSELIAMCPEFVSHSQLLGRYDHHH
jgi:hypothetical protein